jgi:integrase
LDFCQPGDGKPYVSIYRAWNTARQNVGLSDVRMHDLGHSFASLLINAGRIL